MLDQPSNLNIEQCSDTELKALVRQILPIVLTFIKAGQRLFDDNNQPNNRPCDNCSKKKICKKPCEKLEAELPGTYEGSHLLKNTCGTLIDKISDPKTTNSSNRLDDSELRAIDKVREDAIFDLFLRSPIEFSKREWRLITLKIQEGLTFKAIGEKLGIATSTASDTYQRAKRNMENYYRRQIFEKDDTLKHVKTHNSHLLMKDTRSIKKQKTNDQTRNS